MTTAHYDSEAAFLAAERASAAPLLEEESVAGAKARMLEPVQALRLAIQRERERDYANASRAGLEILVHLLTEVTLSVAQTIEQSATPSDEGVARIAQSVIASFAESLAVKDRDALIRHRKRRA